MKWIIPVLIISVGLNVLGGHLLFKPKPAPKAQYIYITNQNYLPPANYEPTGVNINYEHQPGDASIYDYISELNQYRTNSFSITNYKEGYAEVRLVQRTCQIPLPKIPIYKPAENIVTISANLGNVYFAQYERLLINYSGVSLYGGISAGLAGSNSMFLGVCGSVEF